MFALPALKLGWIAVTGLRSKVEEVVDHLETLSDTFLSCHLPIQEALTDLFSHGQPFVHQYRQELLVRRDLAAELLHQDPRLQFSEAQGGFYLMIEIKDFHRRCGVTEEEFVIRLMKEKNIFVHPGYFYDYERGIHCVISFLGEREKLKRGIEGLLDFIS